MKRLIIVLLVTLLCLTACSNQGQSSGAVSGSSTIICWSEPPASSWSVTDSITISLPQDTYPVGTDSFTVTLTNTGSQTMLFGESYSFSYNDGSGWKALETIENYGFHMIGYLLGPGQTQTLEVSPWMLTSPLPVGRCRIIGCSLRVADGEDQLAYGGNYTEYEPYQLEFNIVNVSAMG